MKFFLMCFGSALRTVSHISASSFSRSSKYATERFTINEGCHASAWAFFFAMSIALPKSPSAYPLTLSIIESSHPSFIKYSCICGLSFVIGDSLKHSWICFSARSLSLPPHGYVVRKIRAFTILRSSSASWQSCFTLPSCVRNLITLSSCGLSTLFCGSKSWNSPAA